MPSRHFYNKRLQAREDKKRYFEQLPIGEFQGQFRLEWIGPDYFKYLPDQNDPFRYLRKNRSGKVIETIIPEEIKTDGGSIPRLVQAIPGLSAWEYGPAYLIHDWEFIAHDLAQEPDNNFTFDKSFEEVNTTLAEAILTLMRIGYLDYDKPEENISNIQLIHSGVSSAIAYGLWEAPLNQ